MVIKYFCDVCGEETERNYVSDRFKPELVHEKGSVITCKVMVAIDGTWNGGIICEKCLRDVLTQPERGEEKGNGRS